PGHTCICTPCNRRFLHLLSQPLGHPARGVRWLAVTALRFLPTRYGYSRRREEYALRILLVGPSSPSLISALVTLGHSVTEDPADPDGYDVVHAFGAVDVDAFEGPLVVSVTEAGRHQGFRPAAASRTGYPGHTGHPGHPGHLREARTCAAATRV